MRSRRCRLCVFIVGVLVLWLLYKKVNEKPLHVSRDRDCGEIRTKLLNIDSRYANVCLTFNVQSAVGGDRINVPKFTTALPAQNGINFHYIVLPADEATFDQKDIFLRIIVFTEAQNYWRRMAIRQTWGNVSQYDVPIRLVYLLGLSPPGYENSLQAEIDRHGDILQGSFVDTYKNLTYKTSMGLRWVSEWDKYQRATFVLKVDDDVFVNMFELLEYLGEVSVNRTHSVENWISGNVKIGDPPIRDINSKWYVSPGEYPGSQYPPYCSGVAYLMSRDVTTALYCASRTIPFLRPEDVYFTGFVARKLGLQHENIRTRYDALRKIKKGKVTKSIRPTTTNLITHYVDFEDHFALWNSVLKQVHGTRV